MADGVTYAGAPAACVALALVARGVVLRWRRLRAERVWQETCARYPWRVAAAREHPALVALGDDVLRGWWEREGRLYPTNADLLRGDNDSTKGP